MTATGIMTTTGIGADDGLELDPRVDVVAMAQIVYDLVAGGLARAQARARDMDWLRAHANVALLGRHEYESLEALGARLSSVGDGATPPDSVQSVFWL